ncbi:hypothetical protein [Coleofasciculus sp. H7-2]|uniref:hypothetical protein n=1 Tax=Coleofasciculus sp. H7-2 TaxID=3351545 RepID=UPI003670C9E9
MNAALVKRSKQMQWIRVGSPLLLLTLLTACSSQSSTKNITKDLQVVTSWAATVQMVSNAWIRGAVPTAYTKQTLKKAKQELEKETSKLTLQASTEPERKLLEELHHLEVTLSQISQGIEREDRPNVAQQIQELTKENHALNTQAKSVGVQQ